MQTRFPRLRVQRSTAELMRCIQHVHTQYAHVCIQAFFIPWTFSPRCFLTYMDIFSLLDVVWQSIFPMGEPACVLACMDSMHACTAPMHVVPLLGENTKKNIPIPCGCYKMSTEARVEAIPKNCIALTACVLRSLTCVLLHTIHMHWGVINHPHV